jgi:hypothetical protein
VPAAWGAAQSATAAGALVSTIYIVVLQPSGRASSAPRAGVVSHLAVAWQVAWTITDRGATIGAQRNVRILLMPDCTRSKYVTGAPTVLSRTLPVRSSRLLPACFGLSGNAHSCQRKKIIELAQTAHHPAAPGAAQVYNRLARNIPPPATTWHSHSQFLIHYQCGSTKQQCD